MLIAKLKPQTYKNNQLLMIICERTEPFKLPNAAQVSCKTNNNQQTLVARTQEKHILTFASKN
jgi:hypothetical protein